MLYTKCAARTGRILGKLSIPDFDQDGFDLHNSLLIEGDFDEAVSYLVDGQMADRPESEATCDRTDITADGHDIATISGLPVPCSVWITGPVMATADVDEGAIEFSASVPGEYRITVEAFPVRRYEVTIHAV